ncbi:peroxiredoxin family protein [Pseudalkalibacillus sp. SCS-8]|uniref:peroxiredoxin family protein n=1 Tax=Pseudalkalibacillus nanhaiensis TaxID=3115291 RepID=UPI0032DBAE6B
MQRRLKFTVLIGLIMILGALAWVVPSKTEQSKQRVDAINASADAVPVIAQMGKQAPDFKLKDLSGKDVQLSDFKGKTVVLNFWTTWCSYCKKEIPELINFHLLHQKENVVVLAVNLSSEEENVEQVSFFAEEFQIPFTVPLDQEGTVGEAYQVFMIPTTYIIGPDGLIQNKIMGPVKLDQLEQQLKSE